VYVTVLVCLKRGKYLASGARERLQQTCDTLSRVNDQVALDVKYADKGSKIGDAILAYCDEKSVNVLQLTNQHDSAIRRIALGSTCDFCLEKATIPVLIYNDERRHVNKKDKNK
jgi:nucleotide-binding universal stress UspA family protein